MLQRVQAMTRAFRASTTLLHSSSSFANSATTTAIRIKITSEADSISTLVRQSSMTIRHRFSPRTNSKAWGINCQTPTSRWIQMSCVTMPQLQAFSNKLRHISTIWTCLKRLRCLQESIWRVTKWSDFRRLKLERSRTSSTSSTRISGQWCPKRPQPSQQQTFSPTLPRTRLSSQRKSHREAAWSTKAFTFSKPLCRTIQHKSSNYSRLSLMPLYRTVQATSKALLRRIRAAYLELKRKLLQLILIRELLETII